VPPSVAQRTLCGRNGVTHAGIHFSRLTQSPGNSFEAGLGNVVGVNAIVGFYMQRNAGRLRQSIEEFAYQFGIKGTDLFARKLYIPNEKRTTGNINSRLGHRLVHRQIKGGIAANAAAVSQGLIDGLAKSNAAIFNRVVVVNMKITCSLDGHVDQRVFRQLLQHVIKKSDPGGDIKPAVSVYGDAGFNGRFTGSALDAGYAGHEPAPMTVISTDERCLTEPPAMTQLQSRNHSIHSEAMPMRHMDIGPYSRLENNVKNNNDSWLPSIHATTIIMVRKGGEVVIAGDGQASMGQTIMKSNSRKVRQLGKGDVICGFAGSTADAFTLLERLESKLEQYPDQLMRACVELAKDWRTDRYLRRLEAMMLVADKKVSLCLTGVGDVFEPEDGVMAIGSGGNYALAAARALYGTKAKPQEIAEKAMNIAADICVYTNHNLVFETLKEDK
jgi:ATP-dependent HslUV protease subunit HslV